MVVVVGFVVVVVEGFVVGVVGLDAEVEVVGAVVDVEDGCVVVVVVVDSSGGDVGLGPRPFPFPGFDGREPPGPGGEPQGGPPRVEECGVETSSEEASLEAVGACEELPPDEEAAVSSVESGG